jgi:hypothetical protein
MKDDNRSSLLHRADHNSCLVVAAAAYHEPRDESRAAILDHSHSDDSRQSTVSTLQKSAIKIYTDEHLKV